MKAEKVKSFSFLSLVERRGGTWVRRWENSTKLKDLWLYLWLGCGNKFFLIKIPFVAGSHRRAKTFFIRSLFLFFSSNYGRVPFHGLSAGINLTIYVRNGFSYFRKYLSNALLVSFFDDWGHVLLSTDVQIFSFQSFGFEEITHKMRFVDKSSGFSEVDLVLDEGH